TVQQLERRRGLPVSMAIAGLHNTPRHLAQACTFFERQDKVQLTDLGPDATRVAYLEPLATGGIAIDTEALELLAEATVTIPEIGTITATHPPIVVMTSNRTRDLHDAVKRRCLYQWIDYPDPKREVDIVRRRVKGASATLAVQVADAVSRMRESDIQKPPGIAEAIDWVAALDLLGVEHLDVATADRTLGSVLKYSEDQEVIRTAGLDQLVEKR
ncbi:MAG: MoxR family ATPase, partial [Actinobacteria bacterium]|nr:MoxR family ATPase [Actinomycetota bacterium]